MQVQLTPSLKTALTLFRDLTRPIHSYRAVIHCVPRDSMGANPMLLTEPVLPVVHQYTFGAATSAEAVAWVENYCKQYHSDGACWCHKLWYDANGLVIRRTHGVVIRLVKSEANA